MPSPTSGTAGHSADVMLSSSSVGPQRPGYCGKCFGWLYFRKPASVAETDEDGELFSDNASRVEMVSHIVKTRLMPLCVIFFCCVIPNFVRVLFGDYYGGAELFFGILFGTLFVIYVYMIVYCVLKLKRIRKKYEQ